MPMEEKRQAKPHSLTLDDRKALRLTGVTDIDSFDEQTIVVFTGVGELVVRGNDLHIGLLNIDTGELSVTGSIGSLSYVDQIKPSHGLFGRLFR